MLAAESMCRDKSREKSGSGWEGIVRIVIIYSEMLS
jgi:hypothetical protein